MSEHRNDTELEAVKNERERYDVAIKRLQQRAQQAAEEIDAITGRLPQVLAAEALGEPTRGESFATLVARRHELQTVIENTEAARRIIHTQQAPLTLRLEQLAAQHQEDERTARRERIKAAVARVKAAGTVHPKAICEKVRDLLPNEAVSDREIATLMDWASV